MEIVELTLEHEPVLRGFLGEPGEPENEVYFAEPNWTHAGIVDAFARQSRSQAREEGRVPKRHCSSFTRAGSSVSPICAIG